MLKVPHHGREHEQPPGSGRPVGELIQLLFVEGMALGRAEVGWFLAFARAMARASALPAGLLAAALFVCMAALNALAFGVVLALAKLLGPLLAGFAGMLLFAALAGGLVWYALGRLKRDL